MSDVKQVFERDLPILRELASKAGDVRLSALLLASSHGQVQQILEERISEGNVYLGALLSPQSEQVKVVFSFRRADGQFGLLPLSVLAVVDLQEQCVVKVVNYYLEASTPGASTVALGDLRPGLDLVSLMQDRSAKDKIDQLRPAQGVANGPQSYWV